MKSKLFFVVGLVTVLFISTTVFAQQEEITLSTYYPAPYGEYDELCAEKLLVDLPSAAELQDMARGDCHITNSLIVGAGGGFSYDEIGGSLTDGRVLIKGNVGIGTTVPDTKLGIAIASAANVNDGLKIFRPDFNGLPNYDYLKFGMKSDNNVLYRGAISYVYNYGAENEIMTFRISTGNVGIGTTDPVAPLTVERNADVYLGHIIAAGSGDSDAVLALATATVTEDAAIFLDKSDSNKLKIALGNTDFEANRNAATKLTIQQDGNVGIGTASPGAKLEVAGDAKITGGLKPDYDSGWYADNAQTNHKTTLTHNLGVIPSRIQFWFSPDNPPSNWVYPVSVYGMSVYDDLSQGLGYRTPEGIRVNGTTLEYWAFYRTYMYSYYDTTASPNTWVTWDTGYYRVQMWK